MHKFLIQNGVGTERDFGAPAKAAAFAKKFIGRDAVIARKGADFLWMAAGAVEYFRGIEGDFEVINTAVALLGGESDRMAAQQAASNAHFVAKAGAEARRVRHVKFGEGTVIGEDAKAVTVLFASQKKPLRMAAAMLETI